MLRIIPLVTILVCAHALTADTQRTETFKNGAPRFHSEVRIAVDGYYSENHHVITRDGYILEMNRIPKPRFQFGPIRPRSKPVVFLMHGLQSAFTAFIAAGHRVALAYILADAGYDVWMGNARGVMNSRRHLWLNPDAEEDSVKFFDYTYEDVATKDLPAMIDYVLRITQQEQLNYIGHSQGGTAFLVLNSLMPAYNSKFVSAHLLAGVGHQNYFPNSILGVAAISTDLILAFAVNSGAVELLGPDNSNEHAVHLLHDEEICSELEESSSIVCKIKSVVSVMREILAPLESVAGASIKQYAHYGQNIRDKSFRRWNYNPLMNLLVYGRVTPPEYDLSLITADVTMHYGLGDELLHEQDVLNMAKVIPNAKVRKVARDTFNHFDFVLATDSRELLTDYIIKRFNEKNM